MCNSWYRNQDFAKKSKLKGKLFILATALVNTSTWNAAMFSLNFCSGSQIFWSYNLQPKIFPLVKFNRYLGEPHKVALMVEIPVEPPVLQKL